MAQQFEPGPESVAVETGLFVYGVVASSPALPDGLTGLDEAPLRSVDHGRIAALVGDIAVDRPPGRRVDLLAYNGTLDAVAEQMAVVPVQFGSVLQDEDSVIHELLAPEEDALAATLEQLEGRSQFTFQAQYLEPVVLSEIVAANPDVARLRDHTRDLPDDQGYGERVRLGELVARELEDKQAVDSDLLLQVVLPLTVAHVVRPVSGLERLLDLSVLVDDDRRDEFETALESLAEGVHERIRLRLMGPMAPYDFVGDR